MTFFQPTGEKFQGKNTGNEGPHHAEESGAEKVDEMLGRCLLSMGFQKAHKFLSDSRRCDDHSQGKAELLDALPRDP